jgi:RND family efflux transporter MFP subunit
MLKCHYQVFGVRRFVVVCSLAAATLWATAAAANEVEGFTTPYRVLNIAAPEPGVVDELLVCEGDRVRRGDILVRLDNEIHMALLAIAKAGMELEGRLTAAQAELVMRQSHYDKLVQLNTEVHLRPEEIERAQSDLQIARGNALAAQEELLLKRLEYERIKAQINRRHIRAPIDGVVSTILKQQGEFAAANDPDLLVLVQLDTLYAEFAVPRSDVARLRLDDTIKVYFVDGAEPARGKIEFISPLTDAESGTVRVKVQIRNPHDRYRSGDRCSLRLGPTAKP